MPCKVGQRVSVNCLHVKGEFPGKIVGIESRPIGGQTVTTVKLDRQEKLLGGVVYLDPDEEVVNSSLWQSCKDSPDDK